jgi:hypothetical protein
MNFVFYENIVYGKTVERAIEYLENLVEGMAREDILDIRKNDREMFVETTGSRYYKTVPVMRDTIQGNRGVKGYRYDTAYVDKTIPQELIDKLVKPYGKFVDYKIIYFE